MTAACLPLESVVRLVIEPMVAPVLSLTGMPTVKLPVVALVLALDPVLAEGAVLDEGWLLYGGGADAPPDEGAPLGAASADPAMSATLAAAVKRSAGRI